MRTGEDLIVEGDLILRKYVNEANPAPRLAFIAPDGSVMDNDAVQATYGIVCTAPWYPWWQNGLNKVFIYCPEQNAKVGINTDNPLSALDVRGTQYIDGKLGIGTLPTQSLEVIGHQYLSGKLGIGNTSPVCAIDVNTGAGTYSPMKFVNSNGTLFELDNEGNQYIKGNVGIGVQAPNYELEVDGDQYLSGNLGIGSKLLNGQPLHPIHLHVENNDAAYRMLRLAHSQPGQAQANYNELFFVSRLDDAMNNNLVMDNDFGIFWTDRLVTGDEYNSSSGLVLAPLHWDNYNRGIRIDNIGRVGIGIREPSTNLEIQNGALKISGSHGEDGDTRFLIDAGSTSQHFLRFTNGNGDMLFVNNEGKLYAHEIEVKLGSFPDFVFDDGYKLRTLAELEQYIAAHKHLPGVPSEQEVLENGLNLGEMDALLLQKVEELTLYVIELQKQIKELKQQEQK